MLERFKERLKASRCMEQFQRRFNLPLSSMLSLPVMWLMGSSDTSSPSYGAWQHSHCSLFDTKSGIPPSQHARKDHHHHALPAGRRSGLANTFLYQKSLLYYVTVRLIVDRRIAHGPLLFPPRWKSCFATKNSSWRAAAKRDKNLKLGYFPFFYSFLLYLVIFHCY